MSWGALHRRVGPPVAVLVDEYDKPILDALEAPDVARANRDFLRGVCPVIKDRDAHVRFAFLTGVSTFSKVSLFSGLKNLKDSRSTPATRPSAATRTRTSMPYSRPNCRASTDHGAE